MTIVRKAVFPVAGLGTRFLPATKSVPKEMLPLIDRPLIQYAVDEAQAAGIEEFIFITSEGKTSLEDYFGRDQALEQRLLESGKTSPLENLRQTGIQRGKHCFIRQDAPRGLGHAVSLARKYVGNEPFAVILPDDVIHAERSVLAQMVANFSDDSGHMVATEAVSRDRISSYGVVDIVAQDGRTQKLRGLVEKPAPQDAPSRYGIVGRYILQPSIFDQLDGQKPGSGGEIQLTDAIANDLPTKGCSGFAFEGERFDCGSVAGYLEATAAFALRRADLRDGFERILNHWIARTPRAA